jgi:hypothetical protein
MTTYCQRTRFAHASSSTQAKCRRKSGLARTDTFFFGRAGRSLKHQLRPLRTDHRVYKTTPASGLRITWFGHASSLVEIDGVNLHIDPVWDERAAPTQWACPKRFLCLCHKDVHGANPAVPRSSCTTEGRVDERLGLISSIDAFLTPPVIPNIIQSELFELTYVD